jgi:hypothetical protein
MAISRNLLAPNDLSSPLTHQFSALSGSAKPLGAKILHDLIHAESLSLGLMEEGTGAPTIGTF